MARQRQQSPSVRVFAMAVVPFLLLLLVVVLTTVVHAASDELQVDVYAGPTKETGGCITADDRIQVGDYAKIHFSVKIDESSPVGQKGKEMESTRDGDPIGVTLGQGDVIPAWDQGLVGLCKGDKVKLKVPPALAYGEEGTGNGPNDIPGGAIIQFDVEIVSVLEGPIEDSDDDDEEATQMFESADKDKDGKLSRTEFDAMFYAQTGDVENPDELAAVQAQLDHFWESQDANGDNFLSLEEFLAPSAFDHEFDERPEEDLDPEEEFAALDHDGDGKLSKKEIEIFFGNLQQEVPDDFWEHLDVNKDGYITFDEFFDESDYEGEDEYEDFYGDEEDEDGADEL